MTDFTLTWEGVRYEPGQSETRMALLRQLVNEELAEIGDGDCIIVPWETIYAVLGDSETYRVTADEFGLPAIDPDVLIRIARDPGVSISDEKFDVRIEELAWHGQPIPIEKPQGHGGWFQAPGGIDFLVPLGVYRLMRYIAESRKRSKEARGRESNLMVLADVRRLADEAGALLDTYLEKTRVLRPKELLLDIRKVEGPAGIIVEVFPHFDGQPSSWLHEFDKFPEPRASYKIAEGSEYWEIIVDPPVREGLKAIKALPARRATGSDAHSLIENPFAFFGPAAAAVFNEANIEEVARELQRDLCQFSIASALEVAGPIGLLIEPIHGESGMRSTLESVTSVAALKGFCQKLRTALKDGAGVFEWRSHRLIVDGDGQIKLDSLVRFFERWVADIGAGDPSVESPPMQIDLSIYTERVEGIGIETPYSIIKIPRPPTLGAWFPEDIVATIAPIDSEGSPPIALTKREVEAIAAELPLAKAEGRTHIELPGRPPIPVIDVEAVIARIPVEVPSPPDALDKPIKAPPSPKPSLLIASNIDSDDYVEERAAAFDPPSGVAPRLPTSLREGVHLKQHQEYGVAWLQHLVDLGAENCRGALLADDMGLGKTLQLLSVVMQHLEDDAAAGPALVIAPVTLLENWRAEIDKFFDVDSTMVFSLYGPGIKKHLAGPSDVAPELAATARKLLQDGWIGPARIVLTTYETVRDLEFSLAEIDWSFVICDEAQKIKNPNALLSRATKKLKARFRVAATGTPVENSLQDIWSIFDFVQPGLLEPLNRFATHYQRPIEARTPEQFERIASLRALLDPQILRRTKEEVARDLPEKRFDEPCKTLEMSDVQRKAYIEAIRGANVDAIESSRERSMATINVLQRLRRICCDPFVGDDHPEVVISIDDYRRASPKFDWLVRELEAVRTRDEKAIVFVEARDIQRQLKIQLDQYFGLEIEIINGQTSTSATSEANRQKIIDRFQAQRGFGVIILSPLAAGVGLNIQAANHVIHYMRHWNPAREDQATDRAYRIGQEKPVVVYTPIITCPDFSTFDERLDELLEHKRALAQDMYNGADDVTPDDLVGVLDL